MAYFPDLSPYAYGHDYSGIRPDLPTANVGWLQKDQPYPTGEISPDTQALIKQLVDMELVNTYRGWHTCDLGCDVVRIGHKLPAGKTGNGEIRVVGKDKVYVAPKLLWHYVTAHNYLPPTEFLEALK